MKNKYKILGGSVMLSALLLSGCTDNVEKINNDNVVTIGKSKVSLDKVKKDAELDSQGKITVTEGLVNKALQHYYMDKVDKKEVNKAVKSYKDNIEKSSKQKISDDTEKEIRKSVTRSFLMTQAQNDLIALDVKEIEKEQKAGYELSSVIYASENGLGSKESKKELDNFKKDMVKSKKGKQLNKVANKYSKSNLITSGTLVISKDVTSLDKENTEKVLKAKKGDVIEWQTSKNGNHNLVFVADKWKASVSELIMYKKANAIKTKLPTDAQLLRELDKKIDDFKISDSVYEIINKEEESVLKSRNEAQTTKLDKK